MSDFTKELEGKAYQLCNGLIELEEFKSWFALAKAGQAPTEAAAKPARKDGEFSDYYGTQYEPMDDDMRKHHRDLMGSGDSE